MADHLGLHINDIRENEAIKEIGLRNLADVNCLKRWLDCPDPGLEKWWVEDQNPPCGLSYRRVPSIITRSESELFGVSLPRFALRIHFRPDQTEFVNARRTVIFADQARSWGKPQPNGVIPKVRSLKRRELMPDNRFRLSLTCPGWILHTNSCIADSVLQPPRRLEDGFHIISSPLSKLYGKTDSGAEFHGTPFIKHIPLSGGGLCAQAVCFMSTLLLLEEASAVYGIAEISKLAMGNTEGHLLLTGMSPNHLKTYFSRVGLNLHSQSPADQLSFAFAMKAYVKSNNPIILPVDAGIMSGHLTVSRDGFTSILKSNNVPPLRFDKLKPRAHAVVILGYNDDFFVLHDPCTLPFLTATKDQLWDAGRYASSDLTHQLSGNFFAVVPGAVKLPVVETGNIRNGRFEVTNLGIINLAERIFDLHHNVVIEETLLIQLTRLSNVPTILATQMQSDGNPVLYELARSEIARLARETPNDPWVWLQNLNHKDYLLWEAGKEPPAGPRCSKERAREYLFLHIAVRGGTCLTIHKRDFLIKPSRDDVSAPESALDERLNGDLFPKRDSVKKALLSSFRLGGTVNSHGWPEEWKLVEKYMLMQNECERSIRSLISPSLLSSEISHFLKYTIRVMAHDIYRRHPFLRWVHFNTLKRKYQGLVTETKIMPQCGWTWPKSTALQRLSILCNWNKAIHNLPGFVADNVHAEVIAFATFFPEISSGNPKLRKMAARSLKTLCDVAGRLNRRFSHQVGIIELVGGSLVNGIWPGISEDGPGEETAYVANLLDRNEGIERIVEVLLLVAPVAKRNKLRLAVELEPGPLYILRDLSALELFCNRIEKEPLLTDCVGLNLDVAHWHLAGIKPFDVPDFIRKRIIHCHANDTHKGHCIDLPPGSSNGLQFLSEWLALLPSGYVTCEMEACPNSEWLKMAHKNLELIGLP